MNREQKVELVNSMKEQLVASQSVILVHYRGLSDEELYKFRNGLKEKGASLKIMKNTLAKIAVDGTDLSELGVHFVGPVAICFGDDAVALAKATIEFAKEYKALEIKVGYMDKSVLSTDAIDSLSKLASLDELRSSFLSLLTGAQSKFVRVANAPASQIVTLFQNYVEKQEQ